MTKYKLYNSIKRNLRKQHPEDEIQKKKLSFSLLKSLFMQYELIEYCVFSYCCRGEDYNCWIDEDTCWYKAATKLDKSMLKTIMNKDFYQRTKRAINMSLSKTDVGKRSIYLTENDKFISVIIPLRDVSKMDYYITFAK